MPGKPPYIFKLDTLRDFLGGIPTRGTPSKVTQKYLSEIGFTSSADRPILPILKWIGFLSPSGVPTDRYKEYRDPRKAKHVLAQGIREGYADLYKTHPQAHEVSKEKVKAFYRANTDLGDRAVTAIVSTYSTLCEMADFGDFAEGKADGSEEQPVKKGDKQPVLENTPLTLNINLQLQLPATDDAAVYNALFRAMSTHLIRIQDE